VENLDFASNTWSTGQGSEDTTIKPPSPRLPAARDLASNTWSSGRASEDRAIRPHSPQLSAAFAGNAHFESVPRNETQNEIPNPPLQSRRRRSRRSRDSLESAPAESEEDTAPGKLKASSANGPLTSRNSSPSTAAVAATAAAAAAPATAPVATTAAVDTEDDLIDLSEAAAQAARPSTRAAPDPAPTTGGSSAGTLGFLRDNPPFQKLRQVVQQHPQMLEPILNTMAQGNPELAAHISQSPEEFLALLLEDADDDAALPGPSVPVDETQNDSPPLQIRTTRPSRDSRYDEPGEDNRLVQDKPEQDRATEKLITSPVHERFEPDTRETVPSLPQLRIPPGTSSQSRPQEPPGSVDQKSLVEPLHGRQNMTLRRLSPGEAAWLRSNPTSQATPGRNPGVKVEYSQGRSDDGEMGDEEAIEMRVARIKARVAELAGQWPCLPTGWS
jgi:XPC-binding domain